MRDLPEQVGSDVAASELADLRQQVAELRQALPARDDFITIAAHELRNPMTPIIAVADLALAAARKAESTVPPRVTSLFERMRLLAQDFIQRSARLLDVSRIEAGNLRLEPSLTDLSALMLGAARKYEVTAARARSPVEIDVEAGIAGLLDSLAVERVRNLVPGVDAVLCGGSLQGGFCMSQAPPRRGPARRGATSPASS